jgi:hypothetical protein
VDEATPFDLARVPRKFAKGNDLVRTPIPIIDSQKRAKERVRFAIDVMAILTEGRRPAEAVTDG